MVRKSSGNLHFYINGLDQGVAATRVPQQMWGVVDLYGMTVKVSFTNLDIPNGVGCSTAQFNCSQPKYEWHDTGWGVRSQKSFC